MQVSVEATEGLGRRMTVSVPGDRIATEVQKRLQNMAPKVKLSGFRPGKVPFKVIEKRFGPSVRQEVVGDVISSTYYEAIQQEQLKPAGMPAIENQEFKENDGIEFTAVFEVYPEVEVKGIEQLKIERPVGSISDNDIDEMLEKLRKQRVNWVDADRAAHDGDKVTVDYKATIDGESFEGGEGQGLSVTIGSGAMIPGFEEKMIGVQVGENVEFDVPFPDKYMKEELAGKMAHFVLDIKTIQAPELPEIDDEFAKSFGIEGGLEAFRVDIRDNMQRELDNAINSKVKNQVMDALYEANPIELPKVMIDEENKRQLQHMQEQLKQSGQPVTGSEYQPEQFEAQSKRRVALGLILSEIVKARELTADADKVRQEVESIASAYGAEKDQVVKWYYGNRDRLTEVESMVLENEVVAWVLDQAQVTDNMMTFDQVVNPVKA